MDLKDHIDWNVIVSLKLGFHHIYFLFLFCVLFFIYLFMFIVNRHSSIYSDNN